MDGQNVFDKIVDISRLKRAGITKHEARAHAEAIEQAPRENVATKPDIESTRNDLQQLQHRSSAPSAT
jgi:hypothetical protein